MAFLLAVDGGGTKTALAVSTLHGEVLAQVEAGASSLSRRSMDQVAAELTRGIAAALAQAAVACQDCVAACGGFASAGNPENQAVYAQWLQAALPHARVQVVTDAEIAWRGAGGGGDALVVIAGTGSIAWGHYRGLTARSGGDGPGRDIGSADWIVRRAVAAGWIAPPADDEYAALLPRLAAHPGLAALLEEAGSGLAALLHGCARQLDWFEPVAHPVGGVFQHFPALQAAVARHWPFAWRPPQASPLAGALALAAARVR